MPCPCSRRVDRACGTFALVRGILLRALSAQTECAPTNRLNRPDSAPRTVLGRAPRTVLGAVFHLKPSKPRVTRAAVSPRRAHQQLEPVTPLIARPRSGQTSDLELAVLREQFAVDFDLSAGAQVADQVPVDRRIVDAAGLRVAHADGHVHGPADL